MLDLLHIRSVNIGCWVFPTLFGQAKVERQLRMVADSTMTFAANAEQV